MRADGEGSVSEPMSVQQEARYKTATFDYNEDGPGRYTIMATKVISENRNLRRRGWESGSTIYVVLSGGFYATGDLHALASRLNPPNKDTLIDILKSFEDGEKSVSEFDGVTFGPEGYLL